MVHHDESVLPVRLLAESAAGRTDQPLKLISEETATQACRILGAPFAGWVQFQALHARILGEQPDFLD